MEHNNFKWFDAARGIAAIIVLMDHSGENSRSLCRKVDHSWPNPAATSGSMFRVTSFIGPMIGYEGTEGDLCLLDVAGEGQVASAPGAP
jgi:hypothetical protein